MYKQRLINKFLQLPLAQKTALLCAGLCFCTSLVLILASLQSDRQLIQQSSELFGDSLIRQLATEASNPLVQGDKLSLQSLLKKLVKSPLVMSAAIYDVANRPLAEAGTEQNQGQSLSTSITFQDSIAGYAVINLDIRPLQQHARLLGWQLVLLALMLSGLGYLLSLFPARYISTVIKDLAAIASIPASKRTSNIQISYPGRDELQQLASQLLGKAEQRPNNAEPAIGCAVTAFKLVNLEALRKDLSPSQLQQLFTRIEQQLSLICRLYGGEIVINSSASLCLTFKAGGDQDQQSYPFRALCAGYLMMQWQQQQSIPLLIQAGLALNTQLQHSANPENINQQLRARLLMERATTFASLDQQLVAETKLIEHQSIKKGVITKPFTDTQVESIPADCLLVEKLAPSYEQVLQQQLLTLKAKLAN